MAPPAPGTVNRQDFCAPILKELSESADAYGLFRCSAALADCQAIPIDEHLTAFTLSSDEARSRQCVTAVLRDQTSPDLPTLNTRMKQLHTLWQQVSTPNPSDQEEGMLEAYLQMRILSWIDDDQDAYFTTPHGQDSDHLWQLRNSLRSLQARWQPTPPQGLTKIVTELYERVVHLEQSRGNVLVSAAPFLDARLKDFEAMDEDKPPDEHHGLPEAAENWIRLLDCRALPLDRSYETLRYHGASAALETCWKDWTYHPKTTLDERLPILDSLIAAGNEFGAQPSEAQCAVLRWRLHAYVRITMKAMRQEITTAAQAERFAKGLETLEAQAWTAVDPDLDPLDPDATTLRQSLAQLRQELRAHGETLAAAEDLSSGWAALRPDGLRFQASIGRSETSHTLAVRDPYAGFDVDYTADPAMAFGLELLWNLRPWLSLGVGAKLDWQHFVADNSREPFVENFHTVSGGPSIAAYFTVWNLPWRQMALVLAPVLGATFGTLVTPEAVNVGHPSLLYRAKNLRPFCNVTLGGQVLVNIPVSDHFTIDVGFSASAQYLEYADGPLTLRNPWAAILAFAAAASYYF